MTSILIFIILGLWIGSFLNVVAFRVPQGISIIFPLSQCPQCGHRLYPLDLFPVVSFLWRRGKCRYCEKNISYLYPTGEVVTAGLFVMMFVNVGWQVELIASLLLSSLLMIASLSDIRYQIIPDKVVVTGMVCFFMFRLFFHPLPLWHYFLGFVVGGGFLFLLAVVSKGGMGGGDIKLAAMYGLGIGWQATLLSIFSAAFFAALFVFGVAVYQKGRIPREIAFGPFLALSAVLTYLWGDAWLVWYFSLFFG